MALHLSGLSQYVDLSLMSRRLLVKPCCFFLSQFILGHVCFGFNGMLELLFIKGKHQHNLININFLLKHQAIRIYVVEHIIEFSLVGILEVFFSIN